MRTTLTSTVAILLWLAAPSSAHRLDEYLQATLISVEKDRVQARIRLTPGVAVFPIVLATIDTDADGAISEAEQRAYAERVLRDVSLSVDGRRLTPRIVSAGFPPIQDMKEGRGEIHIHLEASLPRTGPSRRLIFENHHLSGIAAYLVNCLVPSDPDIRVISQNRNYLQSSYQLEYMQAGVPSAPRSFGWWSGDRGWLAVIALFLLVRGALLLWRRRKDRDVLKRLVPASREFSGR